MSENTINLLLQIPLAGVVIVVVVLFLRHLKEYTDLFLTYQQKQFDLFILQLEKQREQHLNAVNELTAAISRLDVSIDDRLNRMAITSAVQKSTQKKKEI